jgi:polysaccharide export outer membrane protein
MTIKKSLFYIVTLSISIFCISCGGANKFTNMVYMADSVKAAQLESAPFEHRMDAGDRIQILVTALNSEAAMSFNLTPILNTAAVGSTLTNTNNIASTGYLVDSEGDIQFPQIGKISVKDKTVQEVSEHIRDILTQYLKEPVVIVNITNFKVNVLGEVARPGSLIVPDGRITILEALSQCGDLTVYGKRENVLVVREKNGKREFGKVNLTSKSLFESSYYNLEKGDVVYVEMNKNRLFASDADEARKLRFVSLLLTSITAIGIIINALNK